MYVFCWSFQRGDDSPLKVLISISIYQGEKKVSVYAVLQAECDQIFASVTCEYLYSVGIHEKVLLTG